MSFLCKNKILSEKQYGFRPKHSCVHALIDFTEKVRKNMDKELTNQACFIGLSKAFDSIKHERLISKLEICGFRGKFLNLIKSYPASRYQFVELDSCWSEKKMIKYGDPQGSVLGPLLILIYINDLPANIGDADSVLYAGDTTIFISKKDDNLDLLKQSEKWFRKTALSINPEKCNLVSFGNNQISAFT